MEYQRLGTTDLEISRIGFGCWGMGGHGYGNVDDRESIKAVRQALDMGINFFDTADVYGFGHAEEVLSKALGSQKNKVVVATKFGVKWKSNGHTYKDCRAERVQEALDSSLRRLKMDSIPVYQIHWHDDITPIEDVMEVLVKCRDAGKIQHIGCCNLSKDLILQATAVSRIESYQCLYNLVRRENERLMEYFSENLGVSILVYGVIGRGIFSAKYDKGSRFGKNDTRTKDVDFQGARYEKNILVAQRLREMGEQYGKTAAQMAIRWTLDRPEVACAITGIKNGAQARENADAVGWVLAKEDLAKIDSMAL